MKSGNDGASSSPPALEMIEGGRGFKPETFTPDELLRAAQALLEEADGSLTYEPEEVILSAESDPELFEGLKNKARERRRQIAKDLGFGSKEKINTVVPSDSSHATAPLLEMVRPPKPEADPADAKTDHETSTEEPVVNDTATLREAINLIEDSPNLLNSFCRNFETKRSAVWVLVALRGLFIYLRKPYVDWAENQRTPEDWKEECKKVIASFEASLISIAEILAKLGLDPRTKIGRKMMAKEYFLDLAFQEELKAWFRANGYRLTLLYPRDYLNEIQATGADTTPDPRWKKVRPDSMRFGKADLKGLSEAQRQKKAERRALDAAKRAAMRGASQGGGGKKGGKSKK